MRGHGGFPRRPSRGFRARLHSHPSPVVSLDLLDSLQHPGDHFAALGRGLAQPEAILGFSSKGRPVTLWGCFERRKNVNPGAGFTKTSFHADIVMVGAHLGDAESSQFKKLSAEYRHLAEWAGISGFSITVPYDHAAHPMVIEHKRPDPVTASVAWEPRQGVRVALEVEATLRDSADLVGEAKIRQRTWASVEYPEGGSFGELNRVLHQFRNFLTLGVGKSVAPLAARGRVETEEETPVEIYYRPLGARDRISPGKKVHRPEMLFTLGDIHDDFGKFIGNWFEKAELLGPVHDLYFATAYGSSAYLDDRFLSLVQGLEAYHRRALGTMDLSGEKHEQRLGEILDAAPEAHREWLQGKLAYSNEPSLRKRLAEILRGNPEVNEANFGENGKKRDGFMYKVVETRNYLTHYDESKKETAAPEGSCTN